MIVANNASYKMFVGNYGMANAKLQDSMQKLSSGSRLTSAGSAPADLGISERFRAQIHNSEEAGRVIQNGINLFQSTDAWLQQTQGMLNRMSELAVAATDSSKSQADRTNLDLEYQQLKSEIGRISEAAKYNGLQVAGKTSVAHWDPTKKTVVYTQPDGSDMRTLGIDMRDGNTALNGIEYAFENSAGTFVGDFTFSNDGRYMIYAAQANAAGVSAQGTLMRLDLESNTIAKVQLTSGGGSAVGSKVHLVNDNAGRIWVSDPLQAATAAGNGTFGLKLLDVNTTTLDAGGTSATNNWAGSVTMASGFPSFTVYNDAAYFVKNNGGTYQFVKQNIFNSSDTQVLLNDISGNFALTHGMNYTVSADGQYISFEESAGKLSVINTASGKKSSLTVGTAANSIVGLKMDANNNIFWTDTGAATDANAIKRASIQGGDLPLIQDVKIISQDNAGRLGVASAAAASTNGFGLSVTQGSPASRFKFQVGADAGMMVDFVGADARLTSLGVSTTNVLTVAAAQDSITRVGKAIEEVSRQRAIMGAEVSRLNFISDANSSYNSNISSAESRIRDVDFASETAKMSEAQILAQASTSILSQANQFRSSVLKLLQ